MLIALSAGFIFAVLIVLIGKLLRGKAAILSALVPAGIFVYFSSFIAPISQGHTIHEDFSWAPSLGVNLSFHLDGLSLLFALMITGIGALVFLYTSYYLKGDAHLDRFYAYLSLFMASMLGLVLSDNVICMFIFWELTSITSFFLIGYKNNDEGSRKAALVALGVTGLGGMALLAGVLIMGGLAGTFSFQEMLQSGISFQEMGLYPLILFCVFGAAFTKSAQFPFHFWLPGAMKAPTPVSTYLHSATMVKAGIYLLIRMQPALGSDPLWSDTLLIVGAITMVYGAIQTLFHTDLKAILAYSTVSALGIIVFLIGVGTPEALLAAIIYILVHATYKGTLFLVVGIVDHSAGTRDITRLAGLGRWLWPAAGAGLLAALSNGGVPPLFGFLGKELVYTSIWDSEVTSMWWIIPALVTNICLFYAGYLAGVKPFLGKPDASQTQKPLRPVLWIPALLLGLLCLVFGLFPHLIQSVLAEPAMGTLAGKGFDFHLSLWHGFNEVLLLSAITLAAGVALVYFVKPSHRIESGLQRLAPISPLSLAQRVSWSFKWFSRLWTRFFQNDYLRYYILMIMTFLVVLIGVNLLTGTHIYVDFASLLELAPYEMLLFAIMFTAIGLTVFTSSRLTAVASLGVVGYTICLIFVFYSAPDLAMTQFTIDTLTVILFVLILFRLPKYLKLSDFPSRLRDGVVAISFGLLITLIALEVLSEPVNHEISRFYAENAYHLAKGKNVVNVILVDFRGIDTFVEISVLVIAAAGVFSLLQLRLRKSEIE